MPKDDSLAGFEGVDKVEDAIDLITLNATVVF